VRCLFADTIANILYVGGHFETAGGLNARGIAKWDGNNWDTLQSGIDNYHLGVPNNVLSIIRYNNELYVGGAFTTAGNVNSPFLARWNGNLWMPRPFTINDVIGHLNVFDNNLILGGDFTKLDTVNAYLFASYNAFLNTINSPPLLLDLSGSGSCVIKYNGSSCFGGNLISTLGDDLYMYDSINGVSLLGLEGNLSFVNCMTIFNNELYIGGYFYKADGNAGNNIMKWDGVTFSDVGNGVNYQVNCMKVFNGELYVGGNFTLAGSIPVKYIARWDGSNWHSLNNVILDNGISALETFQNSLYVAGAFTEINGISTNRIAKYSLNSKVENIIGNINNDINVIQEGGSLFIYGKPKYIKQMVISNILGKTIFKINNIQLPACIQLNLNTNQIYFLAIVNNESSITRKFIGIGN
jgi:hypothetical protein